MDASLLTFASATLHQQDATREPQQISNSSIYLMKSLNRDSYKCDGSQLWQSLIPQQVNLLKTTLLPRHQKSSTRCLLGAHADTLCYCLPGLPCTHTHSHSHKHFTDSSALSATPSGNTKQHHPLQHNRSISTVSSLSFYGTPRVLHASVYMYKWLLLIYWIIEQTFRAFIIMQYMYVRTRSFRHNPPTNNTPTNKRHITVASCLSAYQ